MVMGKLLNAATMLNANSASAVKRVPRPSACNTGNPTSAAVPSNAAACGDKSRT